jgi:hypothetical protein
MTKWALTALVMLLLLFVSLVACELLLRTFAPIRLAGIQSSYQYDDVLGYRLRPGYDGTRTTDHLQEIHTNTLGSVNYQESFRGYGKRVFALGDSYTQGTGLSPDAAYPFQLDLTLNLDSEGMYSERYAVVNLGLAAFGGEQSLLALKEYAGTIGSPDFVLYLGSDNDHSDDRLFLSGYRHTHIVAGNPNWGPLLPIAMWASDIEVFKQVKLAVGALRRARIAKEAGAAPNAGKSAPTASPAEQSWDVILRIRDEATRQGAEFAVSWANYASPSYGWLEDAAMSEGIVFVDWNTRVESVRERVPAIPVWNAHSGGHLRPWVNRVMADAFADVVRGWDQPTSSE